MILNLVRQSEPREDYRQQRVLAWAVPALPISGSAVVSMRAHEAHLEMMPPSLYFADATFFRRGRSGDEPVSDAEKTPR